MNDVNERSADSDCGIGARVGGLLCAPVSYSGVVRAINEEEKRCRVRVTLVRKEVLCGNSKDSS